MTSFTKPVGLKTLPDAFLRLNLLGKSPALHDAMRVIERVAAVDATVLIQGGTGTGKELAARAIHYLSPRRDFPFIPVNCGALPDTLLESELFGHERGAFTDAKQACRGLVAQADGGTLFLDEVEAMTPRAQVVLLRFLQDGQYRPVGGRQVMSGNVRIVASSNVDLEELCRSGQFRQDLMFRFRVLSVTMPPLRDRGGDAVLLAEHFLQSYALQYRRPARRFAPATVAWIRDHGWPGNVRELQNLILREVLMTDDETVDFARPAALDRAGLSQALLDQAFKQAKAHAVAQFEKDYLCRLLARASGNVSLAARLSCKDRSALNRLVKKHGLATRDFR